MPYYTKEKKDSRLLTTKERRLYAKANALFEIGVWSSNCSTLFGITLTSKAGVKCNWRNIVQDNRKLRYKMAQLGLAYDDCLCAELSPINLLIHLHGFWRFQCKDYAILSLMIRKAWIELNIAELRKAKGLRARNPERADTWALLLDIVSYEWEKIHGAYHVNVQDIYDMAGMKAYAVKHALKNYLSTADSGIRMRVLKSKHWLPPGWRQVEKTLKHWGLLHAGLDSLVDGRVTPDEDGYIHVAHGSTGERWHYVGENIDDYFNNNPNYIYKAWEAVKDYAKRWCQGEEILLHFGGDNEDDGLSYCLISGDQITWH